MVTREHGKREGARGGNRGKMTGGQVKFLESLAICILFFWRVIEKYAVGQKRDFRQGKRDFRKEHEKVHAKSLQDEAQESIAHAHVQ